MAFIYLYAHEGSFDNTYVCCYYAYNIQCLQLNFCTVYMLYSVYILCVRALLKLNFLYLRIYCTNELFPLPLQDVFTVSVGNLPPGASVLIKITYVVELAVEGECIVFSLPGSVAPWKQEAALDASTQSDVEKVKVKKQRYIERHHNMCVRVCIIDYCIELFKSY